MPRTGMFIRIILVLAAAAAIAATAVTGASAKRSNTTLVGAGSSLIAPAVAAWTPLYSAATIQYSAVGSGAGIADITNRTVDFGASDAPMTTDQFTACKGCVQIPWALTGTVPVVNIPGVVNLQLKLSGQVLAQIYLGQITNWNDPAIAALNPGLNLPNLSIKVVHRSDGSGDTYVFTNYLSKVSSTWASQVGYSTSVQWPVGVGAAKNAGVAGVLKHTSGSIGYVSVAYVLQNHLRIAKLKNASGKYTEPTIKDIEAAAQLVNAKKIPSNNDISITNPPKTKNKKYLNAYPLSTFTYVIVPTTSPKATDLKAFIKWALTPSSQKAIQKLVFAPMPASVIAAAEKTLKQIHS